MNDLALENAQAKCELFEDHIGPRGFVHQLGKNRTDITLVTAGLPEKTKKNLLATANEFGAKTTMTENGFQAVFLDKQAQITEARMLH